MDLYLIRQKINSGISINNIKLRVTYYSRVSTDQLAQKKSLINQNEHFEDFIKNNPNWIYVEGYVDLGISGTSDKKRDSFMQMIEDARNGLFDLIVTKEISRFSRNTLDSIKYTRELLQYGVAVFFINDNINTILPDSELRLTIMASMAQDEIRRLSERVKFGMNRAIHNGEILGNDTLYGYKKDKSTGNLTIIDTEAKIVQKIYRLYAIDKLSLAKIAKELNKMTNKKWFSTTISRMIQNPKYKGFYCGKKSEVVDYMTKKIKHFEKEEWVQYEDKIKIPPLVDKLLWERANQRLLSRKKNIISIKTDNQNSKRISPYSAKIFCKQDLSLFYRRKFRKNGEETWLCSKYLKDGKKNCNTSNLRNVELNYIFKDLIKKLSIDLTITSQILITNYKQHIEIQDNLNTKIEKEINLLNQKKEKILDLNLSGYLSNEEYKDKKDLFDKKIEELKRKQVTISTNKGTCMGELNNLLEAITHKLNSNEMLDKVVSIILNKIVVSKDKNKNTNLDIILNYKCNNSIKIVYKFTRGYDTKTAKKQTVKYIVKVN